MDTKMMTITAAALLLSASSGAWAERCKQVDAALVEDVATVGCRAPATRCFFGAIDGRGLEGTSYFASDSAAVGPSTSPGWVSYSGLFEYQTEDGTLSLRETGVVNRTTGTPDSGAVTAYQAVQGGTGALAGATGHLWVNGTSINGHVETRVSGIICTP